MATTLQKVLQPSALGSNDALIWYTEGATPYANSGDRYLTSSAVKKNYVLDPERWYQTQTKIWIEGRLVDGNWVEGHFKTFLQKPFTGMVSCGQVLHQSISGVWQEFEVWEIPAPPPARPELLVP